MYNRLIAIYIFLIGFFTPGLTYSQPKYEIRATWLTTLGGLDWPSQSDFGQRYRTSETRTL